MGGNTLRFYVYIKRGGQDYFIASYDEMADALGRVRQLNEAGFKAWFQTTENDRAFH